MNPNKKINSIEEISDIIRQVSERMDEKDLEGNSIEFRVMQPEALDSYLVEERGASPETASLVNGHTLHNDGKYTVRIRSMDLYTFLETYFHELGHIATLDKMLTVKADRQQSFALTETFAYLFQGYAQEKFNELGYGWEYPEAQEKTRELFLEAALEDTNLEPYRRKSLQMIREMLRIKDVTFEQLYKTLKGQLTR